MFWLSEGCTNQYSKQRTCKFAELKPMNIIYWTRGLLLIGVCVIWLLRLVVGEPKSRIVQKHTFFAPERYTAEIFYTDSQNSA